VSGIAFDRGDMEQDLEAVEAAKRLAERIRELGDLID
jgi:hypothetical protein